MSNFVIRELTLYRHFLLIDSPIPFEFIANPTNYNKDMADFSRVTGLDVCSRPSGCWRVDCWKLLPREFQRNNPVFTMLLKYDADLLGEGEVVDVRYSDIDVGEGVAGVNGQLVQILPGTFQPVIKSVDALQTSNHADLGSVKTSVDALQTSNHADLGSVKTSVDALQTSNHADLGSVKTSVDALQTSNHADLIAIKNSFISSSLYFEGIYNVASLIRSSASWEGHYYCNSFFVLEVIGAYGGVRFRTSFNASSLCKVDCFLSTSVKGSTATSTFYMRVNGEEVYRDVKDTVMVTSDDILFSFIRFYCAGSPVPHHD